MKSHRGPLRHASLLVVAMVTSAVVGCDRSPDGQRTHGAHPTSQPESRSTPAELTDKSRYTLLSEDENYSILTEYFSINGELSRQLKGASPDSFAIRFAGENYEIGIMRGATDNKGRISITAGTGAVVSVSHVSGKTLELVAHVEGGTKLEMRQAKDGRRALILRATGATALITEREPWVQELAKPTGAEIWKAGAYDVMRSTDGGFIEFAIPEDQRSLLIVPLRPTPG